MLRAAVMLLMFAYSDVFSAVLVIVPVEPMIAFMTTYDMTSNTEPIIIAKIEPTSKAVNAFLLRYLSRNINHFTSLLVNYMRKYLKFNIKV